MKRILSLTASLVMLSGCGTGITSTTASLLEADSTSWSAQALNERDGDRQRPSPAERFAELDADSDGFLALEELESAKPAESDRPEGMQGQRRRGPRGGGPMPEPTEMIETLDTDKDGKISLAEFEAGAPEAGDRQGGERPDIETIFKQIDADSDGSLTAEEFAAAKPPEGRRRHRGDRPMPEPADIVAHLDTDEDGKVSLDEFKKGPGPRHPEEVLQG